MKKSKLSQKRIWEIDALRGYVILWVLIYHMYTTVYEMFINGGYASIDPVQFVHSIDPHNFLFRVSDKNIIEKAIFFHFMEVFHMPFVDLLFVISGISVRFSNNNLKNGIRLLFGAAFVSMFTKLLALYTGDETQFIRFGVLHCYAMCHLIHYYLLENRQESTLLTVAIISLVVGTYLRHFPIYSHFALLVPLGIREYGAIHRDYWPIFPMLGWFLIGVVLGKRLYSEKKTLFPGQADRKWHKPLCFLGRHGGLIYCGHIVIYTVVFVGVGWILNLF